jgi:hypothetical protein
MTPAAIATTPKAVPISAWSIDHHAIVTPT